MIRRAAAFNGVPDILQLVIRDDFPNRNLGYPVSIEYEPGRLFTIYYGEDRDGTTCILGSFWELS